MTTDSQYPRMLYRPGKGSGQQIWGARMDTLTVQSIEEELAAINLGWVVDPNSAITRAKRQERWSAVARNFAIQWQFWVFALIGIASLIVAVISI